MLFEILCDRLPDDFLVWYEPRVNQLHPDFIILGPAFGLLIIEVKGWYAGQIEAANNQFFRIRRKIGMASTRTESQASP
jgi:hypothetical protein